MKAATLILLLSNTRLSAYQTHRHDVERLFETPNNAAALDTLRALLRKIPHAQWHILTDLAEENFQHESVPHLSGGDQQALFQRKLEHTYRTTSYRRLVVQHKGGRGQKDCIMLSALTEPTQLDAIVAVLLEHKCALVGIYSVALASCDLLRKLRLPFERLLLISPSKEGRVRHSYFQQHQLRLSRLSIATSIADETRRTRQYLNTLHLIQRDEALATLHLGSADDVAHLAHALQNDATQIRLISETIGSLAERLRLPKHCTDWHSLILLAIARGKIKNHYRDLCVGRFHWLRRLGSAISLGALGVAVAGSFLAWQSYAQASHIQIQIDQYNRQLRHEMDRKKALDVQTQALTQDQPFLMQDAVSLYQAYLARWPDVEPTAQAISRILSDFPLLEIQRFHWQATSAATDAAADAHSPSSGYKWQIVELDGTMSTFIISSEIAEVFYFDELE